MTLAFKVVLNPNTTNQFIIMFTLTTLDASVRKPSEHIVGKGENAGAQHFLLFLQCFLTY